MTPYATARALAAWNCGFEGVAGECMKWISPCFASRSSEFLMAGNLSHFQPTNKTPTWPSFLPLYVHLVRKSTLRRMFILGTERPPDLLACLPLASLSRLYLFGYSMMGV